MATSTLYPRPLTRALARHLRAGWQIARLAATIVAIGFAPSSYRRPWRAPLAAHVVRAAWPLLPWFTVLVAVLSVVVIRIVLVAALSFGLSQLALEMLVRVLVIELIPLGAAFVVALRVTVPAAAELAALRRDGAFDSLREAGGDPLRGEIAPRALAGLFTVLLLAAVSGVVVLVLAYLSAHGFSPWAFERYTRLVGNIFSPAVSLLFALKTCGFAAAVSLVPIASAMHDIGGGVIAAAEVRVAVRMFIALFIIETLSLAGSYW